MPNATEHSVWQTGASGIIALTSYHILESSGVNPVVIYIRDGGPAGPIVVPIRLEAYSFADMDYSVTLYSTQGGWYVEVVSGTADGTMSGWA